MRLPTVAIVTINGPLNSQRGSPSPFYEAVLAETAFHLQNSVLTLAFVRDGLVKPAFVASEHISRLAELAERFADCKPDFADLCIIRLSELHPRYPVVTTDVSDFRVYRRGRHEAIPLIHPPGL